MAKRKSAAPPAESPAGGSGAETPASAAAAAMLAAQAAVRAAAGAPDIFDLVEGRPATKAEFLECQLEAKPVKVAVPPLGPDAYITIRPPISASQVGQVWNQIDTITTEFAHPGKEGMMQFPSPGVDDKGRPVLRQIELTREIAIRYIWLSELAELADGQRLRFEEVVKIGERTGALMVNLGLRAVDIALGLGQGIERAKAPSAEADQSQSQTSAENENPDATTTGTSSVSEETTTDASSPQPA